MSKVQQLIRALGLTDTPKAGQTSKICGIVLFVCGLILFGPVNLMVYGIEGDPDKSPIAMFGALTMAASMLVHFHGRRQDAQSLATERYNQFSEDKPEVLYLRSFTTDPSSWKKQLYSGLTTEEEQLALVLKPFGDLIAIGQPGESLPLPGAIRIYASNAEWQSVVFDHMRSSALVVIRAGTGPGLRWEFAQAFRHVTPERLLILFLNTTADDYTEIVSMTKTDFGITLPLFSKSPPLGFIRFSSGWSAEFLPVERSRFEFGYNDLVGPFSLALRPVFEAHGVKWQQLTRIAADAPPA